MSGRNRGQPPLSMKGIPPHGGIHEPQRFGRGLGPLPPPAPPPHPSLLEESQYGLDHHHHARRLPPPTPPHHRHHHPAMIEERLAVQHQDIQGLLADNQRFAATHVALKQELEASHYELERMAHFADSLRVDKDTQMRELHEKYVKLETDLREADAMRGELHLVRSDVKELNGVKQELTGRVQAMTQDLARRNADLQQVPALKGEIENMKQELNRAQAAIEYEKKGYAESYEHGQVMQEKLVAMAKELEKLRAEMANAEKRAPAVSVGNPVAAYNANYGNPEAGYAGNPYPVGYGMYPVQANAESYPQYGVGPGSWGAYDIQRAQGHR
ncbi:protein FLX-like 1 isoform X2 [Mercurialis annua]|uniref:protein FLX-like 1 isoform X2 n=1 Tax=Mercurialis annua TaxID=3986 RepID=UPI00215F5B48|nr:protein FLX-like 1 isoform X2 [Mercurialis annua]